MYWFSFNIQNFLHDLLLKNILPPFPKINQLTHSAALSCKNLHGRRPYSYQILHNGRLLGLWKIFVDLNLGNNQGIEGNRNKQREWKPHTQRESDVHKLACSLPIPLINTSHLKKVIITNKSVVCKKLVRIRIQDMYRPKYGTTTGIVHNGNGTTNVVIICT